MRALEPGLALDLCDAGERRSPFERALLLLETGRGQDRAAPDDVGGWTLGAVNQAMLELRAATFGRRLELLADCPRCDATCESELDCLDIAAAGAGPAPAVPAEMDGIRLPTCADVIAAGRSDEAPAMALARKLVPADAPPPDERQLTALADAVAARDPLAFIEISLQCPDCLASWSEPLHIADLLWTELQCCADRLVLDVARLAQAFGWRERDILAMSAPRRQRYLDLLPS